MLVVVIVSCSFVFVLVTPKIAIANALKHKSNLRQYFYFQNTFKENETEVNNKMKLREFYVHCNYWLIAIRLRIYGVYRKVKVYKWKFIE